MIPYFSEVSLTSCSCGPLLRKALYGMALAVLEDGYCFVIHSVTNMRRSSGRGSDRGRYYRDFVLLVWYGIIIYSRLLACSSKVQVVERLVRLFTKGLFTKERNPEVVDNLNKISGMFCLNFCQVFKDLNPRTSFNNVSVWNASHSVI